MDKEEKLKSDPSVAVDSIQSSSKGQATMTTGARGGFESSDISTTTNCDKESSASTKSDGQSVIRDKSASRDSVIECDPRCSFVDSISATSGRPNWNGSKDIMADDDPSLSSIKGDSVSATIADYNRKHHSAKHRAASSDNQSRASGCQGSQLSAKNDDSSVNINYYAASCSSAAGTSQHGASHSRYNNQRSSSSNNNSNHHHQQIQNRDQLQQHRSRKHSRQKRNNQVHHHTRNNSATSRRSSLLEQSFDFYDLPQGTIYQEEPIVIRGNGNMTLFGLSNSFNSEFPPALLGRVSREEFERSMSHINSVLRNQQSLSAKLLLFGGLFCCCSLGLSLVWPSIVLKRRSKTNLEKFLANENQRLYSKLGLNWKLGQRCFNRFVEHVLIIEFNPKIDPYVPD